MQLTTWALSLWCLLHYQLPLVDRAHLFWMLTCDEIDKNPLKEIADPKSKILSSFTHPSLVPNQFEFLSSCWTQSKICWEKTAIDFKCSLISFCVQESKEIHIKFRTTWVWVHVQEIVIVWWTILSIPVVNRAIENRYFKQIKVEFLLLVLIALNLVYGFTTLQLFNLDF